MLFAAATGATLSTFSAPIRRKYGGSSRWKSGKDFFLALSLTGIFIVIGSRQSAHLRLSSMLESGQVEAVAGYIQGCVMNGSNVSIKIRERHTGHLRELNVSRVVNCTGPNCDISKVTVPLVVQLRDEGYLQQDPTRIGFEVNDDYQVINRQGRPAENLFYIGPMLKARFWEAIAVPELRVHARRLAERLTSDRPGKQEGNAPR